MGISPFGIRKATSRFPRLILAVLMGCFTSVVLTIVLFGLLSLLIGQELTAVSSSSTFLIIGLIIALVTAVISGAVASYIHKKTRFTAALWLGGVLALLGTVTMVLEGGTKPWWWHAILISLTVPSTVFGAYIREKMCRS